MAGNGKCIHSVGLDRTFSKDELERFFGVVDVRRDYVIFKTMRWLGLRVAEVGAITVSDVNFNTKQIRVWNCKTNEYTYLEMHAELIGILEKWCEGRTGILFQCRYNRAIHPNTIRNAFRKYLKKAGLDDHYIEIPNTNPNPNNTRKKLYRLSTHSFRRTLGTELYNETKDPLFVKDFLRHRQLSSTEIYMRSRTEARAVLSRIGNVQAADVETTEAAELLVQIIQRTIKHEKVKV